MSPFQLGDRSRTNLLGVHQNLVMVVRLALEYTPVDFAVIEGVRDADRQAELVAAGASRTRQSKHLIGHAVDVMACVGDLDHDGDKDENWEPKYYFDIARAFQEASQELGIAVIWGGIWDRVLGDMSDRLEDEYHAYKWHRRRGKTFFDSGHFELYWEVRDEAPSVGVQTV